MARIWQYFRRVDLFGIAYRKRAFTLAEVLITLGVIGVVAMLTMPTLITGVQTRGYTTSAKVFEGRLTEAMKSMNQKRILGGHPTTSSFVSSLSKVMKISKVCDSNHITDCFPEVITYGDSEVEMKDIKSAKNFGQKDWGTEALGLMFANGTSAVLAYNPSCKQDRYSNLITGSDCIAMVYDTTGFGKPNKSGKDIGSLQVTKLGKACAVELDSGACFSQPFVQKSQLSVSECNAVKSELGISNCKGSGPDYWSGAVQACGHKSKLPTRSELDDIANLIYSSGSFNGETASKFGLPDQPGFNVWSQQEGTSKEGAYKMGFSQNNTDWGQVNRYESTYYVFCKE